MFDGIYYFFKKLIYGNKSLDYITPYTVLIANLSKYKTQVDEFLIINESNGNCNIIFGNHAGNEFYNNTAVTVDLEENGTAVNMEKKKEICSYINEYYRIKKNIIYRLYNLAEKQNRITTSILTSNFCKEVIFNNKEKCDKVEVLNEDILNSYLKLYISFLKEVNNIIKSTDELSIDTIDVVKIRELDEKIETLCKTLENTSLYLINQGFELAEANKTILVT